MAKNSRKGIPFISFYNEELINGVPKPPSLTISKVGMASFDVLRVFMDQRSSCDIVYADFIRAIGLMQNFQPYHNSNL